MPIEVRAITENQLPAMLEIDRRGFGAPKRPPERADSWVRAELDRTRCAFDAGEMVGCTRAYSFELTMPGGALVPVAAVSAVAVPPTHRRRGVLTAMMGGLHDDARARGETAAVLTASETMIYGRFGYGPATWRLGCSIDRVDGRFARPVGDPGRVRLVERGEADAIYQQVYEDARRACAGAVSRPDFWWPEVFWVTEPGRALFDAVHEDADGRPDGYVSYEIRGEWPGGADHRRQLLVWDLQAADARTRAALWEFVLSVDLVVTVTATNLPPDEPLRFLLADSRKLRTNYLIDSVWVLPLDAAALLAARTYSASGKLVIEIVDPDSRTRVALDGGPEGAHGAEQQSAVPDVSCSRATLGALSLGGTSWATLAAAGAVDEHTPGALALADAMFATAPAPATMSWF